jgi:hypothetical protein
MGRSDAPSPDPPSSRNRFFPGHQHYNQNSGAHFGRASGHPCISLLISIRTAQADVPDKLADLQPFRKLRKLLAPQEFVHLHTVLHH